MPIIIHIVIPMHIECGAKLAIIHHHFSISPRMHSVCVHILFADCNLIEMISGDQHRIEDSALTASSTAEGHPLDHGPAASRLNQPRDDVWAGGWCAAPGSTIEESWLQVLPPVYYSAF